MSLNQGFILLCKRMTLQFVVLKPLLALLSLVFMLTGHFDEHWWQYTLVVVYNISYSLAIYYLVLFYLATKKLLGGFHAVGKFAAVKIIVFATYYQVRRQRLRCRLSPTVLMRRPPSPLPRSAAVPPRRCRPRHGRAGVLGALERLHPVRRDGALRGHAHEGGGVGGRGGRRDAQEGGGSRGIMWGRKGTA